jgi:hypothetical protein
VLRNPIDLKTDLASYYFSPHFFVLLLVTSITMGLMLKKPEGEAGASWPAIMIGLFVAFGGVLFGSLFLVATPLNTQFLKEVKAKTEIVIRV